MAFCKFCHCNLEPKLSDLLKHKDTSKHQKNAKLVTEHRPLDSYSSMSVEVQVSRAEALWANFTAEHNLSIALHHATRIFSKMFPGSQIAKFSSA